MVRRVDVAELVLDVEDVVSRTEPRKPIELTFNRVEGEVTIGLMGRDFVALPAAAAAYVAAWMSDPYTIVPLKSAGRCAFCGDVVLVTREGVVYVREGKLSVPVHKDCYPEWRKLRGLPP
jgi:hypothetical protein